MRSKTKLFLVVIGLLFVVTQVSLARATTEESNDAQFNLGEVVVTATKTERIAKDVSATVSVITREDIEKSNAKNVGEILSQVSGVYVYHTYGTPMEGKMSLRGFDPYGSERVLIMVNGVPLNSGNDNYIQFSKFPSLEDVERIEVVKGPASALHGGSAMGGAINIITKKAPVKPASTVQTEFGNYGERNYRTTVAGTAEKFNYRVSAGYQNGDGYRDNTEYARRTAAVKLGFNLAEAQELVLDFDIQDSDVAYAGSLTEAQYEDNPRQATSPSDGYLNSSRLALHYVNNINEQNKIETLLYSTNYDYDYVGTYGYYGDIDTIGGEIKHELSRPLLGMESSFLTGLSLKSDSVDYQYYYLTTQRVDEDSKNLFWSLFFQEEITPVKSLTFTLGGRYDRAEYDALRHVHYVHGDGTTASKAFGKFSPKFGALYRLNKDTNIFANISKAFNPPSSYRISTSKYANEDLGPEDATNYEFGLKGLFFERLSLEVSAYQMEIKDEIVSEYVGGPTTYEYYNSGKTQHKGIEIEASLLLTNALSAYVNANFQDAKFKDYTVSSTKIYDGNSLPYAPERIFAWGLRYAHPMGVTYNINANYRSEAYADSANVYVIPGRTIWDTRLDYDGKFKGIDFGVYLGVRNLYDKKYYENMTSSGKVYPAYPRNYMTGVTLKKEF